MARINGRLLGWAIVGSGVWAIAASLLAYLFAPMPVTVVATALAGALGAGLGPVIGRSRWRLPVVFATSTALWIAVLLLIHGIQNYDLFSRWLGPSGAYQLAMTLKFSLLTLVGSATLRASTSRAPLFLVFEGGLLAYLASQFLSGHQRGHIDRPYFLVDPLWSSGYDPGPVFMAVGAVVAVMTMVLACSARPSGRGVRDLGLAVLFLLAIFPLVPIGALQDLPKPPESLVESPAPTAEQRYADHDSPNFDDRERKRANSPVAVVLFEQDYEPPTGIYYFRQRAYSLIKSKALVADETGQFDRDLPDRFPDRTLEFAHEPLSERKGGLVDTTVCLLTQESRPFALAQPLTVTAKANPDPGRFRGAYGVRSWGEEDPIGDDLFGPEVGNDNWDQVTREHYLRLPDDPRYQQEADRLLEVFKGQKYVDYPVARAAIVKFYLDSNGVYSLHTRHARAEDPVASFLFGDRTGYCVYFAHAACFLYRAMGVPARVVGGYAVPAENKGKGAALLVGSRYAHAWPEIYLKGVGWTPFDINPETTLEEGIEPPDQNLQQLLGELARKVGNEHDLPGLRPSKDLRQVAQQGISALLMGLPGLFFGVLIALRFGRAWSGWLALRSSQERQPVTVYRALLQRLAERGWIRGRGETRQEFAERVGRACPTLALLTEIHLQSTLGYGRPAEGALVGLYRQALGELSRESRVLVRVRVFLDPISWLKAR